MTYTVGSLCTGYGGLDMAVEAVFGGELAWVSDIEPGPCALLAHRYPDVPNLGDLTTADWSTVEPVDILTAGFPCQPFSSAGQRKGQHDDRWLWDDVASALGALRPRIAVFENVPGILSLGAVRVVSDLADLRYDARWLVVRASDVGACHKRARWFCLAADTAQPERGEPQLEGVAARARAAELGERLGVVADTERVGREQGTGLCASEPGRVGRGRSDDDDGAATWGPFAAAIARHEAAVGRAAPAPVIDGTTQLSPVFVEWMQMVPEGHVTDVPGLTRAAQLRLLGNGVVPPQAAHALRLLTTAVAS